MLDLVSPKGQRLTQTWYGVVAHHGSCYSLFATAFEADLEEETLHRRGFRRSLFRDMHLAHKGVRSQCTRFRAGQECVSVTALCRLADQACFKDGASSYARCLFIFNLVLPDVRH